MQNRAMNVINLIQITEFISIHQYVCVCDIDTQLGLATDRMIHIRDAIKKMKHIICWVFIWKVLVNVSRPLHNCYPACPVTYRIVSAE